MIEWIVNVIGSENAYEVFSFVLTFIFSFIAVFAFTFGKRRRKLFFLRVVLCFIAGIFLAFGLGMLNTLGAGNAFAIPLRLFCYYNLYSSLFGIILLCYNESVAEFVLLWCCGICAHHIANKTYPLIQNIFGIDDTQTISLFHKETAELQGWEFLLYFIIIIAIMALIVFLFRKTAKPFSDDKPTRRKVAIVGIVFTVIINGFICVSRLFEKESFALSVILKVFVSTFCILILAIVSGIFEMSKKDQDYLVIKEILHQEKAQFENLKTNMEAINTKVHDLKKILNKVEDKINEQDMKELKEALIFYDSTIKTGNDVLDIVLSEKSLQCRQNNIKFTCMAGAQKLTMMTPTQIYSVFGNIMDNAIRASKMLEKEKRFISLTINESSGVILIEESNFYSGDIRVINENSIETSKRNKSKHGYGIKSITYIIDKYHGTTSLSAKDGLFSIKISIPIVNEN